MRPAGAAAAALKWIVEHEAIRSTQPRARAPAAGETRTGPAAKRGPPVVLSGDGVYVDGERGLTKQERVRDSLDGDRGCEEELVDDLPQLGEARRGIDARPEMRPAVKAL